MNVPFAFIATAGALGWVWPTWMIRHQHRIDPRLAMAAWPTAQVLFALVSVGAAVTLLVPGHATSFVSSLVGRCLNSLAHTTPAAGENVAGAAGSVALLVVFSCVFVRILRRRNAQRDRREQLSDTIFLTGFQLPGFPDVWWLDDDRPVAFCLAGPRTRIGASTGLFGFLNDNELDAVLSHERAHARMRHHTTIVWAEACGRTLSAIPLFRYGAQSVRGLSEQAADAAAASAHGPMTVASALIKLASAPRQATPPRGSLAAAQGNLGFRLNTLTRQGQRSHLSASLHIAAITTACVLAPAATVTMVLATLTCS
ncbi:M56 family metallopeptidase [Williamsia herbipolensis]|uniref:M56 family metallopeptidase n=1 Tax=Williamsia herbipolensis TaxID=1603258 RepID=UPI0005F86653|nr:M56 family metallopeptidase [Williamsia herbipolensis]